MSMQEGQEAPVEGQEAPVQVPFNERPTDGPGSGRSKLRGQLGKGFEDGRKQRPTDEEQQEQPRGRQRKEQKAEVEEAPETTETPEVQEPETPAPEAWTKEAKAEWAKVPAAAQAAIIKREQDVARGVQQLKQYYNDIDQALGPRVEYIKKFGHTPAQAVNQLFAWFEALAANPQAAFPALAQSFKFDLRNLFQQAPGQQPQPGQEQPQQEPDWKSAFTQLQQAIGQELGGLKQNFAQQNFAKTEEIMLTWAKDKPYFEDVRQVMAHLISTGVVPPLQNGMADLDTAYDYAVHALPNVRKQVLTAQQKAEQDQRKAQQDQERKAQQDQANRARRASGSLTSGAPGQPGEKPGKGAQRKSVKESLQEAMEELRR